MLVDGATDLPWSEEIEQKVFQSSVGIGPYIEAVFFHKATRTLLVTDAVISVPSNPPEVHRRAQSRFYRAELSCSAGFGILCQYCWCSVTPTLATPAARATREPARRSRSQLFHRCAGRQQGCGTSGRSAAATQGTDTRSPRVGLAEDGAHICV